MPDSSKPSPSKLHSVLTAALAGNSAASTAALLRQALDDAQLSGPELGTLRQLLQLAQAAADNQRQGDALRLRIKEAERAQKHYEAALASSHTGTFEQQLETGKEVWSDTLRRLYGIDDAVEASHEAWLARVHQDDRAGAREISESAIRHNLQEFAHEFRINHPADGLRWMLARGRVLHDSSGKPDRMVGTVIDTTDSKVTEQRLAQRARQQEAVAQLGWHALAGQDLQDLMSEITQLITEVLQVEFCGILELLPESGELQLKAGTGWREGLVGNTLWSSRRSTHAGFTLAQEAAVVIADLQAEDRFDDRQLLLDSGIVSGLSIAIQGKAGPWGILSAFSTHTARFTADDVHFIEAIANVLAGAIAQTHWEQQLRDARGALAARVKERTAQLQASNRELEAFAYSVSHDLRAPLRVIDGFSQVLIEDYGPQFEDAAHGYLLRIRKAAVRMGELIDDLLTLSRVSSSELRRSKVDLSSWIVSDMRDLLSREPERTVNFDVEADVSDPADPQMQRISLVYLLHNAWKVTRHSKAPAISFGTQLEAGQRVFFVRDNGVGFDMSQEKRLFAPFQRLHPEDQFEGTGIGLATVQRVIHRHGGTVWAESQPGEGTTIFFTLEAPRSRNHRSTA
jgi:PAS domain S-box-containing protein